MAKITKKTTKMVGLPPGTLVHIGDETVAEVKIDVFDYDEKNYQEKIIKDIQECFVFKDKPTVTWINIDGIHKPGVIQKIGSCYGFHPLVLEDIMNTTQRPKVEFYDGYVYIVLKMLYFNTQNDELISEQVSMLLGPNYLITFQEGKPGDVFDLIRSQIRTGKGRIRKLKADYLAYCLIDAIIDNYFVILERQGEKIEKIEETLVKNPQPKTLQTIHNLKGDLVFVRRAIWPIRELIGKMLREETKLFDKSTTIYLRDVYDHSIQIIDTVESYRDVLSGMLDIYLSSVSYKMNDVMKILTIISTIFMPLTFITGIYGMNFEHMPELTWHWGYPMVLLLTISVAGFMIRYFKKKDWF